MVFFWGGGLNDIKAMGYFQSLRQQSVIEPSEFLVIEAFSSHPLFPKNCVSAWVGVDAWWYFPLDWLLLEGGCSGGE